MSASALIYFIACHGGPGAHFSEFAKELNQNGHKIEILATGPAYDKLKSFGAQDFNPDHLDIDNPSVQQLLAAKVAKSIDPAAKAIITDLGHSIMAEVQSQIAEEWPNVRQIAYYDNPEPFVPGDYSRAAKKVIAASNKIFVAFSNHNLVNEPIYSAPNAAIELPQNRRIGIGYYPIEAAQKLKKAREAEKEAARKQFFKTYNLIDMGQKILVYFGGNNDVYFEKAFPAFLQLIQEKQMDPSKYLVLLQQHPGAKGKNIDGNLARGQSLILSRVSSEEALTFADAALYYQTSMGPQFVLAGIPSIQIGHETYDDILVRNGLAPSVTNHDSFTQAISGLLTNTEKNPNQILSDLGICKDWTDRLEAAVLGNQI
ncbi:MAG TPA: hypothetical protein VLG49_02505 [Rhabdochlamydiaceae bacterium]|nr:hypothetical protein [Rhabdochlamydiaceae bacterium]